MNDHSSTFPIPNGFRCSGIICGIKEDKSKKDLGLIVAEQDSVLGAVYTQNKFPSAHVEYCKKLTPCNKFRALIVNSGNANAATGYQGVKDNQHLAKTLAQKLSVEPEQVFTSSTGIIGVPFPISTIKNSLEKLIEELSDDCADFSEAIMTTDLKPKVASKLVNTGDKTYTITGFAKGSGMIHPNMATMLAYVLTDAPIPYSEIQQLTRRVNSKSFNCISVDGDTSTNDSFYIISSAPSESVDHNQLSLIEEAIESIAISLAKQIAADGEGANHLIETIILGGSSEELCRSVLHAILTSNLVKTAIHGKDPNWGRLIMAAGNGLQKFDIRSNSPLSISIQGVPVLKKGEPSIFDEKALATLMESHLIKIELDLHIGDSSITGWGCDLSNEYIHINADYTT